MELGAWSVELGEREGEGARERPGEGK